MNIPPITASLGLDEPPSTPQTLSLREHIWEICKTDSETGLLFTIDEINSGTRTELEQFAAIYQHAIHAGLNLALVMCGIPASVSSLLTEKRGPLTFLNRSKHVNLDILDFTTTCTVFTQTLRARGTRTASSEVIRIHGGTVKGLPLSGARDWQYRLGCPPRHR